MALNTKVNIPMATETIPSPNNMSAEANYISILINDINRTNTGQVIWKSDSSGILYKTVDYPTESNIYNKGNTGLYNLLVKLYGGNNGWMFMAEDYNALKDEMGNYLPLSGGNMNGNITMKNNIFLYGNTNDKNAIKLIGLDNLDSVSVGDTQKNMNIYVHDRPNITNGGGGHFKMAFLSDLEKYLQSTGGNVTGNVVLNNSISIAGKITTGTSYNLVYIDDSNKFSVGDNALNTIIKGVRDRPHYQSTFKQLALYSDVTHLQQGNLNDLSIKTSKLANNCVTTEKLANTLDLTSKEVDYFQYSTTEQYTGEKWIDGSKIYTISFAANTTSNTIIVDLSNLNIGDYWMVDYSHSSISAIVDNVNEMLPLIRPSFVNMSEWGTTISNLKKTEIKIVVGSKIKVRGYVVILMYTKL